MRKSASKTDENFKISYETKEKAKALRSLEKIQAKEQRIVSKNLLGSLFGTVQKYNTQIQPLREMLQLTDYNGKTDRRDKLLLKLGFYDYKYENEEKDLEKLETAVKETSEATKLLLDRLKVATQFCLGLDKNQTLVNMKEADIAKKKQTISDAVNISVIRVYLQLIVSAVYDGTFQSKIKATKFFGTMDRWKKLDNQALEIKNNLGKLIPDPGTITDLKKSEEYKQGKKNANDMKNSIGTNIDIEAQNAGKVLGPYRESLSNWTEAVTKLNTLLDEKYERSFNDLYYTTLLFVVNKTENTYVQKMASTNATLRSTADENTKLGTLPCIAAIDFINKFYTKIKTLHEQVTEVDKEFEKVFTTLEIYMRMDDKATDEFCNSIHMRRKNRTLFRTMKDIYLYFKQRFSRTPKNKVPVTFDETLVQEIKSYVNSAIEKDTTNRMILQQSSQIKQQREVLENLESQQTAANKKAEALLRATNELVENNSGSDEDLT